MNLYSKYLKYKSKYLDLKMNGGLSSISMKGGGGTTVKPVFKKIIINIKKLSGDEIQYIYDNIDVANLSDDELTIKIIAKLMRESEMKEFNEISGFILNQGLKEIYDTQKNYYKKKGIINNLDFNSTEPLSIDLSITMIPNSLFVSIDLEDNLEDKLKVISYMIKYEYSFKLEKNVYKLNLRHGLFKLLELLIKLNYTLISIAIFLHGNLLLAVNFHVKNEEANRYDIFYTNNVHTNDGKIIPVTTSGSIDKIFLENFIYNIYSLLFSEKLITDSDQFILKTDDFAEHAKIKIVRCEK